MKLFKNVDIIDLSSILEQGILPASEVGDNWTSGKRAKNSLDLVYLHDAPEGRSFTQYGAALVEVEVEARVNEMEANDVNRGLYTEYVCERVAPEAIKAVYVPEQLLSKVKTADARIKPCKVTASVIVGSEPDPELGEWFRKPVYGTADAATIDAFYATGKHADTNEHGYGRGVEPDGTVFDLEDIHYHF